MIRIFTGILALFLLSAGAILYAFHPNANPLAVGLLIRIGALLGVIWLAYPQLESLKGRLPSALIAVAMICLAVAAARPRLGSLLITIVTIAVSVGATLKWMSKLADNDPKRRR
jgi:hypothetical protein